MHSRLTVILAQQHISDLRRDTDDDHLVRAATTASHTQASTAARPDTTTAAAVKLTRRLRNHLASTHPAAH